MIACYDDQSPKASCNLLNLYALEPAAFRLWHANHSCYNYYIR